MSVKQRTDAGRRSNKSDKPSQSKKGDPKSKGRKGKGKDSKSNKPEGKRSTPSLAKKRSPKKKKRHELTAATADRHVLYQLSVQAPEEDSKFLGRYFKKLTGRPLRVFREDFCGTALTSTHHVRNHRENRAIGVDIHGPTLRWGQRNNVQQLTEEQQSRIQLIESNVLDVTEPKVDAVGAFNFSYGILKTRDNLREYFRRVHESLVDDGVFFLDSWGGSETQVEMDEEREIDEDGYRFTYIWEQAKWDPVTYNGTCKIHFEFEDGTRMDNAFTYKWRVFTLPELVEILTEAGFHDPHVLWEGTDKETDEGNGIYRRVKHGDADPSWIAYVVARK